MLIYQSGFPTISVGKRIIETLIHLLCLSLQFSFIWRMLLTESNKIRLQQPFTTNLSRYG